MCIRDRSNSDLQNEEIVTLHYHEDSLWIIAEANDVILKVGDSFEAFQPFVGSFVPMGSSMITDDGKLIVSTFSKIAVYQGTSIMYEASLNGAFARNMFRSTDGNIYIATDIGVYRYNNDLNELEYLEDEYGDLDILRHGISPEGDYYALLESRDIYFQSAAGDGYTIFQLDVFEPHFEGFFIYQDTLRGWGDNFRNDTDSTGTVITTLTGILVDEDGDGFLREDDCDDNNASVYPGAEEICDNLDNDCNDEVDDGLDLITVYEDLDGDGFGNDDMSRIACGANFNETEIAGDCDDNNSSIYPGAEEIPNNGIDEDCDGLDFTSSTHNLANIQIEVYPNPVASYFFIEFDKPHNFEISLYDLMGNKILFDISNDGRIETGYLNNGLYLLEIFDKQSQNRVIERVLKTN